MSGLRCIIIPEETMVKVVGKGIVRLVFCWVRVRKF
jgi:hypothetical protein